MVLIRSLIFSDQQQVPLHVMTKLIHAKIRFSFASKLSHTRKLWKLFEKDIAETHVSQRKIY